MTHIGIKVGEARVGISTNTPALLEPRRFYWLDTNFRDVERIPFDDAADSRMEIWDGGRGPAMEIDDRGLVMRGPFSTLERESADLRYSLFGNLGIFSAWALRTLEEAHGIHTFHACGLSKEGRLLIIPGGAGAGKSVFLFAALDRGWRLFSTEFVHFRISDEGPMLFKGSLKDAVRVDTFRDHFPAWPERLGVDLRAQTGGKLVTDLSSFQTKDDRLVNPHLILVFPHIEEQRSKIICRDVEDREAVKRRLFQSASEKLDKSLLLYGRMAVSGVDSLTLAERRAESVDRLLESGAVRRTMTWVSGVGDTPRVFEELGM